MKIFFRLLALFTTATIVELALLVKLSDWIGFWPTLALILATAFTGSYLAKREGISAWKRLQGSLSKGGLPGDELLDAVIILVAGAFLITPGVLTDLIGFSGLIPLTRGWIRRVAKRRLKKAVREGRIQTSFGTFGGPGMGESGMGGPPPGHAPDDPAGSGPTATPEESGGPSLGGSPAPRGPSAAGGDGSSSPPSSNEATPEDTASDSGAPSNGTKSLRKRSRPLDDDPTDDEADSERA